MVPLIFSMIGPIALVGDFDVVVVMVRTRNFLDFSPSVFHFRGLSTRCRLEMCRRARCFFVGADVDVASNESRLFDTRVLLVFLAPDERTIQKLIRPLSSHAHANRVSDTRNTILQIGALIFYEVGLVTSEGRSP